MITIISNNEQGILNKVYEKDFPSLANLASLTTRKTTKK